MATPEKSNQSDGIVVVRPTSETMSRHRLPYYVGISASTAGAKNISMNLIVIPPAGAAEPHLHNGYETAIYLLKGKVKTCYGQKLEKSVICREGDFILIRPDVPHQPRRRRTRPGHCRAQRPQRARERCALPRTSTHMTH